MPNRFMRKTPENPPHCHAPLSLLYLAETETHQRKDDDKIKTQQNIDHLYTQPMPPSLLFHYRLSSNISLNLKSSHLGKAYMGL
jgi:hypothetical protein